MAQSESLVAGLQYSLSAYDLSPSQTSENHALLLFRGVVVCLHDDLHGPYNSRKSILYYTTETVDDMTVKIRRISKTWSRLLEAWLALTVG